MRLAGVDLGHKALRKTQWIIKGLKGLNWIKGIKGLNRSRGFEGLKGLKWLMKGGSPPPPPWRPR
ncbi:hypothetical protein GCM10018780_32490 [Streptomyces lanatus]|nr:hypothetical protein GCM10018780_32490 [Streptomyces lanatus]